MDPNNKVSVQQTQSNKKGKKNEKEWKVRTCNLKNEDYAAIDRMKQKQKEKDMISHNRHY